jgi:uncharacterized protein (TIGR02646 family)
LIKLQNLPLPSLTQRQLNIYQAKVNQVADYAERVENAKQLFKSYNTKRNKTFQTVRQTLTQICSGACRCCYCEDSCADEVEHFRPKNLYPELVFVWENYLYACGPCNSPKSNKFEVIDEMGCFIDVQRPRNSPVVLPPKPGKPVLIDPRQENPLDYMKLDLRGTFYFVPIAKEGTQEFYRANYTIKTLGLNRDVLIEARRSAFDSYKARLYEYSNKKANGTALKELQRLKESLQKMHHPTVWAEMKRQHKQHQELEILFAKVPESLNQKDVAHPTLTSGNKQ